MRSELFEEAWKQNRHVWESTECLAQAMYLAGEQHQQSKVDELTLQVAEMKSRLNDAYTDGQSAMYTARQSKVDELQKRVDDLTQVMEELLEEMKYPTATFEEVICSGVRELEQALKRGLTNDHIQRGSEPEQIYIHSKVGRNQD